MKKETIGFSILALFAVSIQAAPVDTQDGSSELNSFSYADASAKINSFFSDIGVGFSVDPASGPARTVTASDNGDITISKDGMPVFSGDKLPDDTINENPYNSNSGNSESPYTEMPAKAGPEMSFQTAGQGTIPSDLKQQAMEYFRSHQGNIGNKNYLAIVDFAQHSSKARFYIINLKNGSSIALHVAHGSGSDRDNDGYATRFSNAANSNMSSLGFYLTGDIYKGKHGRSMRLHGLSSTNSNALSRAVVIHEAQYVREANVQAGRSWGCLAVSPEKIDQVISLLKGGALIYASLSGK